MIFLLHGALASATQFDTFLPMLPDPKNVMAVNLYGHGGDLAERAFSLPLFAESLCAIMDAKGLQKVRLFGYSMGGYVALYTAWMYPDRVESVTTLNTKLDWNAESAERINSMMDSEKIEAKVPALAARFAAMHAPEDWKTVASRTIQFIETLGQDQAMTEMAFRQIQCPVTLLRGANDQVVSEAECQVVLGCLQQGNYAEIPESGHLWEQVDLDLVLNWV
jgi:pimeloyl-ACP methyl ester carboxylesterase